MPRTWKQRLPDWDIRFAAWLEDYRDRAFAWGTNDCLQFGLEGIRRVTGADLLLGDRLIYSTPEVAAALLRDAGFASLAECVTYHLGAPLGHYREASRGDAALVDVAGLQVLGTVLGDRIACPGENGLVFVPLSTAICCWKI